MRQNPPPMTDSPPLTAPRGPEWLSQAVAAEPRLPLVAPMMAYLLLMMFAGLAPDRTPWNQIAIALHLAAATWVTWLFRHHWPPLGRAELWVAVPAGVFAAWLWVAGQHWLEGITVGDSTLGGSLGISGAPPFLRLNPIEPVDIAVQYDGAGFWAHVVLKISRAVLIVPVVEELFWRGFLLRAFIRWDRFDEVPLGQFTWFSFLGTSLLSVVQHPANWGVSILCWMLFNAIFVWRKSLMCLFVTHGVTNLVLYIYVVYASLHGNSEWQFW